MVIVSVSLSFVDLVLNDFIEGAIDFVDALVQNVEVTFSDSRLVFLVLLCSNVEVSC